MKKQYIQPEIKTVKVETFSLLESSPHINVDDSITGGPYPPEEDEPTIDLGGGGDGTNFGS